MTKKVEQKLTQLNKGLESYAAFEQALRSTEELKEIVAMEQKALQDIIHANSDIFQNLDIEALLQQWLEEEKNVTVKVMDVVETDGDESNYSIMADMEASVSTEVKDKCDLRGKEKLLETATNLTRSSSADRTSKRLPFAP